LSNRAAQALRLGRSFQVTGTDSVPVCDVDVAEMSLVPRPRLSEQLLIEGPLNSYLCLLGLLVPQGEEEGMSINLRQRDEKKKADQKDLSSFQADLFDPFANNPVSLYGHRSSEMKSASLFILHEQGIPDTTRQAKKSSARNGQTTRSTSKRRTYETHISVIVS
jgi:hypothetical protein